MTIVDLTRIVAWFSLAALLAGAAAPLRWRARDIVVSVADRSFSFAVVGTLFVLAYPHDRRMAVSFLIVSAIASEMLQMVSHRRDPQLSGALMKIMAVAVGVAVGNIVMRMMLG